MEERAKDFILTFTSIFYEAIPFIVLGCIIAGILEHVIPKQWIARIVPKNRIAAIALSCLLGLIFPMCECGIVPIMRRLLRKGLPLSCCTAYMMCGPVINPIVILSTWVAFSGFDSGFGPGIHAGWVMAGLRVGMAYIVGFITALVIDRQHRRYGNELLVPIARPDAGNDDEQSLEQKPFSVKLGLIAETAIHDFVDITVFLTLGALLSATCRMFFTTQDIEDLGNAFPVVSILAMMGLAIALCLCSEADAFVAASFSTLPAAPKLAFLVLGPMFDLKLYMLFTRVFRPRLIWTIITCVAVQTLIYSLLAHYMLPPRLGMAALQ